MTSPMLRPPARLGTVPRRRERGTGWFLRLWVLACLLTPGAAVRADTGLWPDWSAVTTPPYLLEPFPENPVLTRADVTDGTAAFVADPFIMHANGTWYMFLEAFISRGRIAYATSPDGLHWKYERIVLSEPFHLSYPFVFEHDGSFYMMPETSDLNEIRLYKATRFPDEWTYCATLATGRAFVDPSLFRYQDTWWLYASRVDNDLCYLYYADQLEGPWREHPLSPIVQDRGRARAAGRPIVFAQDQILRLSQKCDVVYGERVRAFQVDVLDRTRYAEHEIPSSRFPSPPGWGWNAERMHQLDAWWDGSRWIAAADGAAGGIWSIGIYTTRRSSGDEAPTISSLILAPPAPNPSRGDCLLSFLLPEGVNEAAWLAIFDVNGRQVWAAAPAAGPGWHSLRPAERTSRGATLAPGVYFCRLRQGAASDVRRLIVLR